MSEPRKAFALYSPMGAAKHGRVVACSPDTGETITYTMLVSNIGDYKYPDAKVVAEVEPEKLVHFLTPRGPMTPSAFERAMASLTDEEYGRVLDAKGRFDAATRRPKPPILGL